MWRNTENDEMHILSRNPNIFLILLNGSSSNTRNQACIPTPGLNMFFLYISLGYFQAYNFKFVYILNKFIAEFFNICNTLLMTAASACSLFSKMEKPTTSPDTLLTFESPLMPDTLLCNDKW
jgi:hypothetical protein